MRADTSEKINIESHNICNVHEQLIVLGLPLIQTIRFELFVEKCFINCLIAVNRRLCFVSLRIFFEENITERPMLILFCQKTLTLI